MADTPKTKFPEPLFFVPAGLDADYLQRPEVQKRLADQEAALAAIPRSDSTAAIQAALSGLSDVELALLASHARGLMGLYDGDDEANHGSH